MTSSAPAAAVLAALPGPVSELDAAGVAGALTVVKQIRGQLDAYEASVSSRADELHRRGQSAPAADLHTRCGGSSSREAAAKERRSRVLDDAPSLATKLGHGETTAEHVDVLGDLTARLDDDTRQSVLEHESEIADDAGRLSPEEFRRETRKLIRRLERDQGVERDRRQRRETRVVTRIDRDGMYVLNARMHPELGNIVFNALDAETAALVKRGGDRSVDRAQVAADALGNLVGGGHQAKRPAEAEIRVHVDAATLLDESHTDGVCEYDDGTPLPPPTVRRMLCNGRIVPIVIDTDGVVLDAGRDRRLANRHQRRALRAMYPTCAHPGCDVKFTRCEIHHVTPFQLGGTTDLAELVPLCCRHHHIVHEPGWQLTLDTHRTLTVRQPDGTEIVSPLRGRPSPSPGRPDDRQPTKRRPAA